MVIISPVWFLCSLQDLHRKVEIERTERRQSDSKALQLLAEVREQSRLSKELRETESR